MRALAPLARTLDEVGVTDTLVPYVDRIARADFARRGPLATRYASIVAGEQLAPAARDGFLAALRAAGQDDILLGALVRLNPDPRRFPASLLPELQRLTEHAFDPWFHFLAVEHQAGVLMVAGDLESAELAVSSALARCRRSHLEYRCMRLESLLGEIYLTSLRLSDARRVLHDGFAWAKQTGEELLEQRFLPQLADLEMLADDVSASTLPVARAFIGELEMRDKRCATQVWGSEELAMMLVNRLELDGARAELRRSATAAATCAGAAPILRSVFAKACVARDDEVPLVRAEIAALRASRTMTQGGQAALDQTEGRLLIDRDRAAGISLLDSAVNKARALFRRDVDAHKARSYAYSSLALDAARAGEWSRVWQLLEDEAGIALDRCGLGAAVEGTRSLVVVRDHMGALSGAYEAARLGPEADVRRLVPAALRDRVSGCSEVDVIARPPLQGAPSLLPGTIAWSYRSGTTSRHREPHPGRRLVISETEPPAELGLPRLLAWRSATPPDATIEGASATPSRVLAAMSDADFIEIHAHGMANAAVSDASFLLMSPEPDGRYALTAAAIRREHLRSEPIVVLAACHAGAEASYRHQPWGLPAAFVEAGARAVIASPDVVADAEAGAFFDLLRGRTEAGSSPALALRDVRIQWLSSHPDATWVRSLMVFR